MKDELIKKLTECLELATAINEAEPEEEKVDVSDLLLLREQFDAKYRRKHA